MIQHDDNKLWKLAQKRVAFRRHFFVYCLVNISLIALWYFTSYAHKDVEGKHITADFWFIYPLFGWGIGLAFHYWSAFYDDDTSVEKEYGKLRKRNDSRSQPVDDTTTNNPTQQ